ncbi:MAG TPA: ferrous iron transport protein B [Pyrinomonadaceae bacterium]|nr:ferrous iron transport protein B [Pyrinomonadaceae bacterium]
MSSILESPSPVAESGAGARVPSAPQRPLMVALAGNPNAGKTTLFNALTGLRQKVANYPGVTVERKEGAWALSPGAPPARLIDLPGLYSLDAASIDEQIARDVITGRVQGLPAPDVIVCVVDATNLERNLYLVTQLLEYGRPLVVALTMFDLAQKRKLEIDTRQLSSALGVEIVPVLVTQRLGLAALGEAVVSASAKTAAGAGWRLSDEAERELAALVGTNGNSVDRHTALRDLYAEELPEDESRRRLVREARARLSESNPTWWQEPLLARYDWIEGVAARAVRDARNGAAPHAPTAAERIDRVLTHKFFGPIILISVMLVVFQTIFSWAALPMDLIDSGFGRLGEVVGNLLPEGLLRDLLVDGVIAGVGGVVVFLPQILLLFFFIAVLEDTGYMARAAFLMDRLMRGVGLHGKAFMPLLSSFACAIPGIMATRTIENPKDRLATIMIAPFMSCSARLPVYTLMIAAFFSTQKLFGFVSVGALMILAMYLLGILVAIGVAWVLKRTILKAPTPPLVLELPPYRVPNPLTILQMMLSRAWLFLKRAGTVILAISIILWALATFPRMERTGGEVDFHGEQLRQSFAGRAGHAIEPVIKPLGFDWKMGVALISSFAARETLVSTLSIIYNAGDDEDAGSDSVINAVREAKRPDGTRAWTPLVALSMMVFFVLAMQCMSTVAIVRRETNSWRWPLFMIAYMTVLAYLASLITYQGGRLLGFT